MQPTEVQAIQLKTLRSRAAGMGVHVYRAGPFLIDAGFAHARRQLLRWPGLRGAEVCLLTHHDEDHVGNAAALARRGLAVEAPAPVLAALDRARARRGGLPPYRRVIWGTPEPFDPAPLSGPAARGDWRLVPIHTPGHSSDHFVYHEPRRGVVFSGDLYIGVRVKVAKPSEDIDGLLASLRRVRDLEPQVLYCAHRGRIVSPGGELRAKIDWIEEAAGRARELAARGLGLSEVTRRVLGREGAMRLVTGGEYCKRNLVRAMLRRG